MRALRPSFVPAIGWYLLLGQSNGQGPSDVAVSPSTLPLPNTPFTITWDGCASTDCSIVAVDLLEFKTLDAFTPLQPPATSALCTPTLGSSFPCYTVLTRLALSRTYKAQVVWAPVTNAAALATTGFQFVLSEGQDNNPAPTASMTLGTSNSSEPDLPITSLATTTLKGTVSPIANPTTNPTPNLTPSSTLISVTQGAITSSTSGNTSSVGDSGSLSSGAKAGIAIGAAGLALLLFIAALLLWRRRKQRQLRALPNEMPYSHDLGSTNHDLAAEKEMHVISSPVDNMHTRYSNIPPVAPVRTASWAAPDEHASAGMETIAAPYTDTQRRSYGSGHEDPAPLQTPIQRKPVGDPGSEPLGGPTHHLREPGMSDEELARLEEEERRLDEAIAEAERRRLQQGKGTFSVL